MHDVTQLLAAIEEGDPTASDKLLPLVYADLRRLARRRLENEKAGQTLEATALVHEVYLRLVSGDVKKDQKWNSRGHFFMAAAESMRRILVENARRKARLKRGGNFERLDIDVNLAGLSEVSEDLLDLDTALSKLASTDQLAANLIQLRYFGGLSFPETAEVLGVSPRTAERIWAYARAWLRCEMQGSDDNVADEVKT